MGITDNNTMDIAVRMKNTRQARAEAAATGKSIKRMGDDVDTVGRKSVTAEKRTSRFRAGVGALARGAKLGALALGGMAVVIGKQAVTEFREAYKVTRQTDAVIKSTGGSANVTAKEVAALSQAISNKTAIDDEEIQRGANLLLTFKDIRNEVGKNNDIFNQATSVVTDMSAALDQDMKSSSIQVGKALNDPIKGMTALQRVGVSFTQDQKDRVKGWVEEGDLMRAQKFILKELNSEFAGSAAAQADPLDKARVAWANLMETVGTAVAPTLMVALEATAGFVTEMQMGTGAGGDFVVVLADIGSVLGVIISVGIGVGAFFVDLWKAFEEGDVKATILVATLAGLLAGLAAFQTVTGVITFLKTFKVQMVALNIVMRANPVILIASALIALGLAFYIAYRRITPFRNAVDATFSFVKKHWHWLIIPLAPILAPIAQIVKHWRWFRTAGVNTFNWVKNAANNFVNFWKRLPGRMGNAVSGMFNGVRGAYRSAINWVINKWNNLEFRTPSVDPPGPGKFPSITIGTPDITPLALGGVVTRRGAALVGDRGPELLDLPSGARVRPLSQPAGPDATQPLKREQLSGMFESHSHVYLDGKLVARSTAKHNSNKMARR